MPRYFSISQCAAAAGISGSTLVRRMRDGTGPRRERFGPMVAISDQALAEWLASGEHLDRRGR